MAMLATKNSPPVRREEIVSRSEATTLLAALRRGHGIVGAQIRVLFHDVRRAMIPRAVAAQARVVVHPVGTEAIAIDAREQMLRRTATSIMAASRQADRQQQYQHHEYSMDVHRAFMAQISQPLEVGRIVSSSDNEEHS